MKLDSRIIEGKKPLTCFDVEEAKKYIGKDCYFASKFENFENLSKVPHATLHNVDDSPVPFQCYDEDGVFCYDCFILPCEWVKQEPKYRPFKDHTEYKEYLNDGIIESWIQIREKLTGEVSELMYVGGSGAIICLGAYSFDLNQMFYDFELFNESTGEWQPFGVLDE